MDRKIAKILNKMKPFSRAEKEDLRKMAASEERWTLPTSPDVGREVSAEPIDYGDEYCPKCYADLTMQKGYRSSHAYWTCLGCGAMLINPKIESDIVWICDKCGASLNIQPGFSEECGEWKCTECGHSNVIGPSELYETEDEYQMELKNPYRGLSDEDVLALSVYKEEAVYNGREDIIVVTHRETGEYYFKKLLKDYDKSIYLYLKEHPVRNMPKIVDIFESKVCLIVIEEIILGKTIAKLLENGPMSEKRAIFIAKNVCKVLKELHSLEIPIIHRDIKPSNILITDDDEVYVLDMNVAKWYDQEKSDDTRYMGTQYYAAPEQVGFGLAASSPKTDIYAVGMLLNVMLTGEFPKEKRAEGPIWDIINKCISLEADNRYTAGELIEALDTIGR